jgi:phage terminase large subunit-like protein
MVKASPELARLVDQKVNNLSVLETGAFFRSVSSEKRGLDGKRVYIALVEELHEHPDGTVVDKMRAGTKGRKNAVGRSIGRPTSAARPGSASTSRTRRT